MILHSIPGIDGYKIIIDGNVWSEKHKMFLTEKIANNGYKIIEYYVNGVRKRKTIHRILAILFISNPDNLSEVNHKDGNKLNNSISNLEWVTHKRNIQHAFEIGLCSNRCKGIDSHKSKLTPKQVIEIRNSKESSRILSKKYGIAHQNIRLVKLKKTWAHVIS